MCSLKYAYMDSCIGYHLTRTVAGPKIDIENPRQGFEIIKNWTQRFTVGTYVAFKLHLHIPVDNYPDLEFLDDEFFRQKVNMTITSGGIDITHVCEWKVVYIRMPELFDLIDKKIDFFRQHNFSIMMDIEFVLLDENNDLLEGQNLYEGPRSSLSCFLYEKKINLEPSLIFPFASDNKKFRKFYSYFKSNFPFKLNDKNLYLYGKHPKTGNLFSRKLVHH